MPPEESAMSTYLPYEANATRVDDLVRTARARHVETPVRGDHAEPVEQLQQRAEKLEEQAVARRPPRFRPRLAVS